MTDHEKKQTATRKKTASIEKNTIYNIIKTFSTVVFPLITFPYTSRVLRAESIGKINFGQSIVGYFGLIATLGITAYAVREGSKYKKEPDKFNKFASQIISINLVTTVIAYILLIVCLFLVPTLKDYRLLLVLQSISIIFTTIGADWINTAMEDFRYITLRVFFFQVISVISLFLFVHAPSDYYICAVISLISTCGAKLLNIFYRRKYCKIKLTWHIEWKKHMPGIMALFVMLVSQSIFSNLDTTMLGFIHGDVSVGLYTTATKITNIVTQVVASITWVVMPQLSYNFSIKNYGEINKLLRYATSFTLVIGLPCIVGINMLAEDMILVVAGEEYINAAACLRILSVSMVASFAGNIYGNMILLSSNREKRFIIACICAAVINAMGNMIMIPLLSINGAAITTTVSNVIILLIILPAIEKEINIGNIYTLLRGPVAGAIVVLLVCAVVKSVVSPLILKVLLCIVFSSLFYFVILVLMKDEMIINIHSTLTNRLKANRKSAQK